jgi:citrate synthase
MATDPHSPTWTGKFSGSSGKPQHSLRTYGTARIMHASRAEVATGWPIVSARAVSSSYRQQGSRIPDSASRAVPLPPQPFNVVGHRFLYQMDHLGQENYKPSPVLEKALDVLFLLHADHELNASCTTVLQTGSSLVDPYSAIALVAPVTLVVCVGKLT